MLGMFRCSAQTMNTTKNGPEPLRMNRARVATPTDCATSKAVLLATEDKRMKATLRREDRREVFIAQESEPRGRMQQDQQVRGLLLALAIRHGWLSPGRVPSLHVSDRADEASVRRQLDTNG